MQTSIIQLLRNTTAIGGQKWSKVVGIGHSYGSELTQAVSASRPELYDAIILQGFSTNVTYLPNFFQAAAYSIARDTLPGHLADKPTTWLVTATPATGQLPLWFFPHYAQGVRDLARSTEQAGTLGELLTVGSVTTPSPTFDKPVQIVLPDKDFIFAGGNAYAGQNGLTIADEVKSLYPLSSAFETYIPANTGTIISFPPPVFYFCV